MRRCLELAKKGIGATSPNPMVGCIIVREDKIIGEGWHKKAGTPHAEVNAIHDVKNKALLKDATLYVNLEPCSHFGKTPPCSDLIIQHQIPRVVIASSDPNPLVSGKGIKKLQDAGCEVVTKVLQDES
jgi:diaminohydroxyphosphoribosylaminopyrimidine deaminase/5-amino-6-(5-phosphoribosylamino)uracil reductase